MNSNFQLAKENFDKGIINFNNELYLEAEKFFDLSLKYIPDRVSTLSNLLICKIKLKKIQECEDLLLKINFVDPKYPYGVYAKALYHGEKLNFLKSKEELNSIINIPNLPKKSLSTFYNCLGTTYVQLYDINESIKCYLKAISLNPNNNEAHFNLGTRYLSMNNFELGWKHYEYRLKKNKLLHNKYPKKINDITNKKVLIKHEQGFGDSIQFSRLIKSLTKYSKKIDFLIPEPLDNLFSIENINIIKKLDKNIIYDYEIYLMSLPFFLNLDLNNPPTTSTINPKLYKKPIMKKKNINLNIGLAWSGNENYNFDKLRSINLYSLKKILDLKNSKNITFYCLQKNIRESDLDYFNQLNINNLGNLKFSNLAEEINKLDLVIACDTSILHLSSSLDVRTYALFPFVSDWRWIDSKINTKWYDSLEIFRLKKDQSWEELSSEIVNKITNLLD